MDALRELIQREVQNQIIKSACIASLPCIVLENLGDEIYKVKALTDNIEYRLVNCSGSGLEVGETVQVYYRNGYISNQTAYIGAVQTRGGGGGSPIAYVVGYANDAVLASSFYKEINSIYFQALGTTKAFLSCNVTVEGTSDSNIYFKVYYDDEAIEYEPKSSVVNGGFSHINITLPFSCTVGNHKIKIMAKGVGEVESYGFVFGQLIAATSGYTPTDDGDYIFEVVGTEPNWKSDVILYVGETVQPAIPSTLGTNIYGTGNPTTIIRATAFNDTNVIRVSIPSGVTEIE